MTEAEIIVKMREALDILKEKWNESAGAWAITDFMGAAIDETGGHWMAKVIDAERLSDPYMKLRR